MHVNGHSAPHIHVVYTHTYMHAYLFVSEKNVEDCLLRILKVLVRCGLRILVEG